MAGGYPCCCPASSVRVECSVCLPGTTPQQYRIDVFNIRNRLAILCALCGQLNGSYVVDMIAPCYYRLDFPQICLYDRIELVVAPGAYGVAFSKAGAVPGTGNYVGSMNYQRLGSASPRDCRERGLTLSPVDFLGNCDHYNVQIGGARGYCQITAL